MMKKTKPNNGGWLLVMSAEKHSKSTCGEARFDSRPFDRFANSNFIPKHYQYQYKYSIFA